MSDANSSTPNTPADGEPSAEQNSPEPRSGEDPKTSVAASAAAPSRRSPLMLVVGVLLVVGGLTLGGMALFGDSNSNDADGSSAQPQPNQPPPDSSADRGAETSKKLRVIVLNSEQQPISGATIKADGQTLSANAEGYADLSGKPRHITITAEGYFGQEVHDHRGEQLVVALARPQSAKITAPPGLVLENFPVRFRLVRTGREGMLSSRDHRPLAVTYARVLGFDAESSIVLDDIPPMCTVAWEVPADASGGLNSGAVNVNGLTALSREDFPQQGAFGRINFRAQQSETQVGRWVQTDGGGADLLVLGDYFLLLGKPGSYEVSLKYKDSRGRLHTGATRVAISEGFLSDANPIELLPTISLTGTLTRSGQPRAGTPILLRLGRRIYNAVTDENGAFAITNLDGEDPQYWNFSALLEIRTKTGTLEIDVTPSMRENRHLELDLDVASSATLVVRVPLGGNILYSVAATRSSPFNTEEGTVNGVLRLNLMPGEYTLCFWQPLPTEEGLPPSLAAVEHVTLDGSAQVTLDVALYPALGVAPSLGSSGIDSATVELHDEFGRRMGREPILLDRKLREERYGEQHWVLPVGFKGSLLFVTPGANRRVAFEVSKATGEGWYQIVELEASGG